MIRLTLTSLAAVLNRQASSQRRWQPLMSLMRALSVPSVGTAATWSFFKATSKLVTIGLKVEVS